MSEVHIRINKRTLERAVFGIIIIVLASLLWMSPGDATSQQDTSVFESQISALEANNSALSTQLSQVQTQLNNSQQELQEALAQVQNLTQAQEETEETQQEEQQEESSTEPELSGELEIMFEVRESDDRLDYATLIFDNGLDEIQELDYYFHWSANSVDDIASDQIRTITLQSGERSSVVFEGGTDISSYPPSSSDDLTLRVTDSDGDLVDLIEKSLYS